MPLSPDAVKDAKDSLDLMTDASKQAKKLYDEAMAAGGRDNISIIAFRVVK